jgi:pimeloyl-ACP methyl ester carboxylesterase
MLQPPGFCQKTISTSLGNMAYYVARSHQDAEPALWPEMEPGQRPTLVFFHGFGGGSSAYEWSKVYPAFAADYRVLAPDLIGWGRSAHPQRDYQIEDYLSTIAEFLTRTCEQPVVAIASSLTAALMVRVAIDYPDKFRALVLVTPAGLMDFGTDYRSSFFAQLVRLPIIDRLIYIGAVANSGGIQSFLENRQFSHSDRIYPEIVNAYLESAQQSNAEYSALSFVRGDLCFDLSQYIEKLQIPTAMLWGEQAQFTGPEVGRRLARMNPEAIRVMDVLDEVGLTPQLELPAVTIGLIRKYLQIFEV